MTLAIHNLCKTYPNGVKALDCLDLEIKPGMFGLLGPNGAGKSTLMRTIATLQQPDQGQISFGQIDVLKDQMSLRKILGYLPQEFGVYPKISAERLLHYFATLKGIHSRKERHQLIDKVLEITNLTEHRRKYVHEYSGGMKQRFGIAQLLLNDPKLIIVDEPTAGLDPAERRRFLNVLREVGTENTVIFSTHIVEDVKELCHQMAILHRGRLLAHNTPSVAIQQLHGKVWIRTVSKTELAQMEGKFRVLSSNYNPDHSLTVRVWADQQPGDDFTSAVPQLDDVYFTALNQA